MTNINSLTFAGPLQLLDPMSTVSELSGMEANADCRRGLVSPDGTIECINGYITGINPT